MKNIQKLLPVIVFMCLYGCNETNHNAKAKTVATDTAKVATSAEATDSIKLAALKKLTIANEEDPACGMPLLRGFDDTTMYKGKIIGFCSKECKDNFLRKPSAYPIAYIKTKHGGK